MTQQVCWEKILYYSLKGIVPIGFTFLLARLFSLLGFVGTLQLIAETATVAALRLEAMGISLTGMIFALGTLVMTISALAVIHECEARQRGR